MRRLTRRTCQPDCSDAALAILGAVSWQTVTASAALDLAIASVSTCSSLGGTAVATARASAIQGSSAAAAPCALSKAEAARLRLVSVFRMFIALVRNRG